MTQLSQQVDIIDIPLKTKSPKKTFSLITYLTFYGMMIIFDDDMYFYKNILDKTPKNIFCKKI